ncbi:unnamed protein product [Leuciscus chuanchicus]
MTLCQDAAVAHTTLQQSLIDTLHPGDSVNLQCSIFSESCAGEHSVYWFRQSLGDSQGVLYTKGERNGQCKNSSESQTQSCVYNLLKSNISDSDTGIYYCAVAACGEILFGKGTQLNFRVSGDVNPTLLALGVSNIIFFVLVVFLGIKLFRGQNKAAHTTLQQSLIDTLHPGDSVNLQCSIFSESCAGEHSVYWFRQSLGDSQGVLYTKGERNGQCKNSSESQTQSCVYNLLKSNISDSDAGIYYCAVAACGEILFGKGTQLNFKVSGDVNPTLLALGVSNIIFFVLVVFLGLKLFRGQNKVPKPQENQNEDSMNYASISFGQKPLNTRRTKSKVIQEQSLYAQEVMRLTICLLVGASVAVTPYALFVQKPVFQLSYTDKERYEMEERPDVQKQILADIAKKLPIFTRAQSGAIRFCDRCQVIKPDRCHHCSVCETCVLKMDHHCPWVNNCVGFSNYKFFLLFLSYSMIYCVFIASTVFQYFLKFWVGDLPNGSAKFHVLFLLFVALMFFVKAFSAPVFQNGPDRNGFHVGLSRNLQQVFGEDKKLWFIPVFTSQGDGHYFPLRTLREPENPLLANEEQWLEDGGSDEESAVIGVPGGDCMAAAIFFLPGFRHQCDEEGRRQESA